MYLKTHVISDTTPNAAGTAVGTVLDDLLSGYFFTVDAELRGATGGVLDVYLQREVADDLWRDWLHFPQLAAAAPVVHYFVAAGITPDIVVVGADAVPALAANKMLGGHPGNKLRAVYKAGTSTTAGAAVLIHVHAFR